MPKSILGGTCAILSGLLLAAPVLSQQPAIYPAGPAILADTTLLTVEAKGEVQRAPDIATVSAGVVTRAASANAALTENRQRMTRVVEALRQAGIDRADIQTRQLMLNPQYRYRENETPTIEAYEARNEVSITVRELDDVGPVLDALVAVGANQFNGPSFELEEPASALDEARQQAMRTARQRAELYAQAAGLSVRRIVSISESTAYMPPPMPVRTMAVQEAAADTPVEPGRLSMSADLTVVFELE